MISILTIVFYILLGLYFLGLRFIHIDKIIGVCALIIGLSALL